MSVLEDRRDTLYQRLEDGYQKIGRALDEGRDITQWEDLWLTLLSEYERVCDQLTADLAAGPVRQAELFDAPRRWV